MTADEFGWLLALTAAAVFLVGGRDLTAAMTREGSLRTWLAGGPWPTKLPFPFWTAKGSRFSSVLRFSAIVGF